jgi:hypothetical protein
METLNFEAKQKDVISFYENKQPVDWIKTTPIKWVIYGPLEEGISSDFTPLSDLQLVYDEQGVKIFEVK